MVRVWPSNDRVFYNDVIYFQKMSKFNRSAISNRCMQYVSTMALVILKWWKTLGALPSLSEVAVNRNSRQLFRASRAVVYVRLCRARRLCAREGLLVVGEITSLFEQIRNSDVSVRCFYLRLLKSCCMCLSIISRICAELHWQDWGSHYR